MSQASGIAVDASRNIYVSITMEAIAEYATAATGNVAPIHQLKGSYTGLNDPQEIAIR
jgi:hypothetical protein